MPKVEADVALLEAIEVLVRNAGGNESEAARRLGTSRLKINRIRKQGGAATEAVRQDLWKKLERKSQSAQSMAGNDTTDTEPIQIVRDVPRVALQVLRYMTEVIERELGPEGHAREH
jgi:hypothetical protein